MGPLKSKSLNLFQRKMFPLHNCEVLSVSVYFGLPCSFFSLKMQSERKVKFRPLIHKCLGSNHYHCALVPKKDCHRLILFSFFFHDFPANYSRNRSRSEACLSHGLDSQKGNAMAPPCWLMLSGKQNRLYVVMATRSNLLVIVHKRMSPNQNGALILVGQFDLVYTDQEFWERSNGTVSVWVNSH